MGNAFAVEAGEDRDAQHATSAMKSVAPMEERAIQPRVFVSAPWHIQGISVR